MPIPSPDYSYLGSGSILVREYGAAAPLLTLGNCSALTLSPQEDVKTLPDHTQPGGNMRNEVRRLTAVNLSYTFHDFSAENFAIGLRSSASPIAGGTEAGEEVVAYAGGYTNLARLATAITAVTSLDDATPYERGVDYELRDGLLYIPADSNIAPPADGEPNCKVSYSYAAQKKVEALVNPNKQYELVFIGLNEARSGKRTRVVLHRVSGGVLQEMSVIGEEYGAGQVNGSLLSDPTKTEQGISQYFTFETED